MPSLPSHTIVGWLFDVYPSPRGVTLWFLDGNGEHTQCHRTFLPSFFLHANDNDLRRAETLGRRCPVPVSFRRTSRRDLYSGEWWSVLQVLVQNPLMFRKAVSYYEQFFPHFAFFNSDILPEQLFLYETQLFPLGFGHFTVDGQNELTSWELHDSRDDVEYQLPPLRVMLLRDADTFLPPKYRRFMQLEVSYDNTTYALQQETPRDMLEALNWHLYRFDPDILLTEYGDSRILPELTRAAQRFNVPLLLNRDVGSDYKRSKESSFFQYGKVIHKDGAFELRGRWHIDADNSFTVVEADLDGLFEIIRVTQLCPQHQARASIGTGLSSLQLSWAYRNHVLIPAKKREPEEFKTAATLLLADRGGLIYMPPGGYHEDVAELDFVSMYPTIMVKKNVSPETINCACCHNARVPELGYTICEKREGIVPATLRSVVAKRAYYKKKKKEWAGKDRERSLIYDRRQNALKWMLVSCFGYLGYKNARFGRIEAHESVNAFSRDAILTAKEVAEDQGYELLHGIIDCVWLKKSGATEEDYRRLCDDIASRTGIDISLEGIYRWLLFPASKMDSAVATGTRYVGYYRHGDVKIRGIEARRRDTPKFIKNMQQAMLDHLADAAGVEDVARRVPGVMDIAREYLAALRSGSANVMDLVIRRHISKEAGEYANNSISATVATQLEEAGIHLMAGESIEFIIVDQSGPEKARPLALYELHDGYDIGKYTELALKAIETLLQPFGYSFEMLEEEFVPKKRPVAKGGRKKTVAEESQWSFVFRDTILTL